MAFIEELSQSIWINKEEAGLLFFGDTVKN
jgi:hypothetical protein